LEGDGGKNALPEERALIICLAYRVPTGSLAAQVTTS